jgi:hypothetical protein
MWKRRGAGSAARSRSRRPLAASGTATASLAILAVCVVGAGCGGGGDGARSGFSLSATGTEPVLGTSAADGAILQELRRRGAHLARPRSARFDLSFRAQDDADAAARELGRGYHAAQEVDAGGSRPYRVRITTTMVVSLASIRERETLMARLAARHAGAFDGWGAASTP